MKLLGLDLAHQLRSLTPPVADRGFQVVPRAAVASRRQPEGDVQIIYHSDCKITTGEVQYANVAIPGRSVRDLLAGLHPLDLAQVRAIRDQGRHGAGRALLGRLELMEAQRAGNLVGKVAVVKEQDVGVMGGELRLLALDEERSLPGGTQGVEAATGSFAVGAACALGLLAGDEVVASAFWSSNRPGWRLLRCGQALQAPAAGSRSPSSRGERRGAVAAVRKWAALNEWTVGCAGCRRRRMPS